MPKRPALTSDDIPIAKRTRGAKVRQATIAAAAAAIPITQTSPFFRHLSVDVRRNIYDFLYGSLPPLSYNDDQDHCRGLILSCKEAYVELSEAAGRHLKLFAEDFFQQHGTKYPDTKLRLYKPIPFREGWAALRNITISVPYSFLERKIKDPDNGDYSCYIFDVMHQGVYEEIWRLLWNQPFDKVTFHVTDPDASTPSGPDMITKYREAIQKLHNTLEMMDWLIGCEWLEFQDGLDMKKWETKWDADFQPPKRADYDSADDFRFARVQWKRLGDREERKAIVQRWLGYINGGDTGELKAGILTKQICFAWNFLASGEPSPDKLLGQKHTYSPEHAEELRKVDMLRTLKYDKLWPHRYEVSGADGLVGEIGMAHPRRWQLASEEASEWDSMWLFYDVAEDVESAGIGSDIVKVEKEQGRK
ncbi:hypothetical protein P280DRAFT_541701 [Massarina eburnea CBS 473.64]|uniref:Uncharacterized protein n=1 Tax=Massarina eburnea CBS 473.64 TaxID=1395130 RepID=A0A6A6S3J6_9PLEO|nr:hypothetical protein P280DRAFT_541701 [Massarina eburnea CBS 473.64]